MLQSFKYSNLLPPAGNISTMLNLHQASKERHLERQTQERNEFLADI